MVTVYVYNTEFSINPPGGPIVNAVITQGDSIRWLWIQGGHTTTAVAGSPEQWNQPINSSNPEFIRQFNNTGVFWYYCEPHGSDNGNGTASGMSGTITVLPAGSGACCLPDGSCITTTQGSCTAQNGFFSGVGSSCDTTYCDVTLELNAVKDNILYESATGSLSNALGQQLYTGNNNNGKRRSVLVFSIPALPSGAELQDVQLKLFCNSSSGTFPITLQKLLQDWGEGTSQANNNNQEKNGVPATPGDATWIHTFYDTNNWTTAGGEYSSTISASTDVGTQNAFYTWSSTQMNADVSGWMNAPGTNFGWIMRGDEATTNNSKGFASRQHATVSNRPKLLIHYVMPPLGACCLPNGECEDLTATQCTGAGGDYQGDGTTCAETSCSIQLTPFLDPLPIPGVATPVSGNSGGAAHYRMLMTEQFQQLHNELPPTRVWGYNGSYPGPTIEAFRDSLVTVQWVNDLRVQETGLLRTSHVLSIDTCLHGPDMTGDMPVAVVHLHGGKVPVHSDGYPENVFAPGDSSAVYQYPNIQPASTIWYHDHALGITRLNVMMGMAGFYLIRDSNELSLDLPSGEYEIPLAIQDRSFNPDGSLAYHEHFEDHFFGDVILVNGKVWPYLNVKKGKYRFRVLNGSNSRAYTLSLSNGASFTQIGSDLGLLETPVTLDSLTLLPGERYDIIIDFSSYASGTEIIFTNSAPAPFPGFEGVGVIPNVMKFIVQNATGHTLPIPSTLAEIEELLPANAEQTRLFELMTMASPPCGEQGMNIWSINGLLWHDITEYPVFGTTEIWTWHNQSGISHPMHIHLVSFQILDRQAINEVTGLPEGPIIQPSPSEKGWKDTAHSPPGFRTRVIARFDGFTGTYPYHCHILEHEDHEMMRQFEVSPCILVTNTVDGDPGSLRYAIECAQPGDTIRFLPSMTGDTIQLDSSIIIDKDLVIENTHAGIVTVSAQNISQLFTITVNSEVTLKNINFLSGNGASGRAFINNGNLTLDGISIFEHPSMPPTGNVILNNGFLSIRDNCNIMN